VSEYLSYAAQAQHYFDRPHESVRRDPCDASPAAWRGPDMAARDDWRVRLDAAQVDELLEAQRAAEATGCPTGELGAGDFPLPSLDAEIGRWRAELTEGRGFLLVSGLPVERWTQAEAERAFWCLGLHLGRPGAQNAAGDLLGHVADLGEDTSDPHVRLYRTASDIRYHCDAADVVGLLCLRPARRGGLSRIVSSVSVYAELLRRRPDLIDRLYEPFNLDVRSEGDRAGLRWLPIPPCRHAGGRLRTFYHSDYFRSVVRHDDAPPLTAGERTLLDLYEEIASDPALYLEMELRAGDVQWLSNHVVLHARTAYEDDPVHKRHLLRLWLSV
jgi:hypothetical protein